MFTVFAHSTDRPHPPHPRRRPRGMAHIGRLDWSFAEQPLPSGPTSHLLSRQRLIGPEQGAIHTDLAAGQLLPGGWLAPHVHAYEEALYVVAGELLVDLGGQTWRLEPGDFTLM